MLSSFAKNLSLPVRNSHPATHSTVPATSGKCMGGQFPGLKTGQQGLPPRLQRPIPAVKIRGQRANREARPILTEALQSSSFCPPSLNILHDLIVPDNFDSHVLIGSRRVSCSYYVTEHSLASITVDRVAGIQRLTNPHPIVTLSIIPVVC